MLFYRRTEESKGMSFVNKLAYSFLKFALISLSLAGYIQDATINIVSEKEAAFIFLYMCSLLIELLPKLEYKFNDRLYRVKYIYHCVATFICSVGLITSFLLMTVPTPLSESLNFVVFSSFVAMASMPVISVFYNVFDGFPKNQKKAVPREVIEF